MAKYTFEMAHLKAEQLRRELNTAEDDYIFAIEKILKREHFKDGKLNPTPYMSGMSKLELSVSFKKLQDAFINYVIMNELAHKLEKDHILNVKLPKYKYKR